MDYVIHHRPRRINPPLIQLTWDTAEARATNHVLLDNDLAPELADNRGRIVRAVKRDQIAAETADLTPAAAHLRPVQATDFSFFKRNFNSGKNPLSDPYIFRACLAL